MAMINIKYNYKVVYIRTNEEKALNNSFKAILIAKGVTFEPSLYNTQA